jgi:hypothetical protein
MLTGMDNGRLKFLRSLAQGVNHERQLDGFRPGAENRDDPTLHTDRPAVANNLDSSSQPPETCSGRGFCRRGRSPLMNFLSCIAYVGGERLRRALKGSLGRKSRSLGRASRASRARVVLPAATHAATNSLVVLIFLVSRRLIPIGCVPPQLPWSAIL